MDTPPSSVCSPCSNDVTPQPTELRPAQSEIHFGDTKNDGTTSLVGSLATGGIAAQDRAQVTFNIENNNYPSQNATRALQENAILRFSPKQLPHFTGRQTELNLMRKKLHTPSSDDDTSPLRFIMWGMAGVGKTQLVHRYLGEMLDVKPSEKSENRAPPFNTIWLKASTPEHLDESMVKILHDIQVHCKISRALRASDRRAKLRNWLAFDCVDKYSDWTLILDDVREQTLSHSRDLIPGRGAKCRVIITTRSGSIAEDFMFGDDKERCCEIKIFDVQTAQEMFWRVSKTKSRSRVEENMVADVVEAVGCLPLAIETAANRARWYTLNEVWAERKTAFDWEDKDLVSYYDDHQHYSKSRLLKNAFDCFWDLIANPETPEADLFGDISFFDSSGISVNLLERQRDQSQGFGLFGLFVRKSEAWTSSSWRDAIHRLERTSLVTQRSDGESQVLWIHNLVQALSRHQLINEGNLDKHVNGGADRLHRAVLAAHKQTGPTENSISCEEVLRHIKSILEFLKEVEKSRTGFVILKANLMNIRESVVKLLWKGGWYKAALITAEETFNARKVILGSRHGDNMIGLNIYIRALLHQGNYKKAEPLIQQAFHELKTSRDRPPEYEIECVTCLDNFAVMLRYKGDFEQAINWSNEAWIEGKSTLGLKNRYTLRCLCNLALAYQSGGYYSKAVKHSRQALRAFEQKQNILHDDDLDTSTSRHHYASALYHQGLYDDAEREIERALYARTISLGEKHPDTLTSLQNNAAILKRQGKYKTALENTQKALQGRHEMLGEDHPDTIASLDHLSSIYLCQGRYDLAEKEAQTAFARGTKAFAPEHPALLASLRNFASARRHLGHLEDAKEYYVEILVRRQEKLRLGHPDTLMSLGDTAWGEATEGYYAAAEDMYQRVYQQQCEEVGKGHPQTLASLNSVAWIRIKLGKYEAAKDAAECAWLSQEETLGMTHPDTLTTMHTYAVILQHQRLDEDAASLSQQVLAERKRVLGDQHPDALASRDSYASALRCLGQYEDAEKLCKQALLKRQELFNGSHPDVLANLDTYTLILQCQNKDSRAQALMALDGRESLEDNNPDKVRSRYNYVSVLRMEGQLAEACKEIEEVLRVQRKILGGNHPDTLSSSHQIGVINLQLEKWEEAEEDLFEAFEGRKKALGVEHPDTLSSLSCYCLAIAQQRPLQEAQNLLNWELGVEEATGGLRRIKSLKDLSQNSRSVSHHAREKATEKLTKIRIAWREDALHQQTDHLKIKLARTQLKQKKGEEAVETLKFIKAHPDQSTFLRLAFLQLGKLGDALGTLSSKGDYDEVEEVMV